jgi:hypothetical protein
MHFIIEILQYWILEVLYFPTNDQVANIFTKSLTKTKFSKLQSMLRVQEVVIKGG